MLAKLGLTKQDLLIKQLNIGLFVGIAITFYIESLFMFPQTSSGIKVFVAVFAFFLLVFAYCYSNMMAKTIRLEAVLSWPEAVLTVIMLPIAMCVVGYRLDRDMDVEREQVDEDTEAALIDEFVGN